MVCWELLAPRPPASETLPSLPSEPQPPITKSGTDLDGGGAEAHHLEKQAQGARRHALPDPADHAARDDHELALRMFFVGVWVV